MTTTRYPGDSEPIRGADNGTRVLYARVPAEMHERLVQLARETGLTLAGVTAEILARGLGPNVGALSMGVRRLHELLDGDA